MTDLTKTPEKTDTVSIREVVAADEARLVGLAKVINGEAEFLWRPNDLSSLAGWASTFLRAMRERERGTYYLAESNGELVGFIGCFVGRFRRTRGVIEIAHVGVLPAFRRQGIGTRLLAACEVWACQRRSRRLELLVSEAADGAARFFEKYGFKIEGRIADAILQNGSWQADLCMGRVLDGETDSRCETVDVPSPSQKVALEDIDFRVPKPRAAKAMREWECRLLAGSSIHFMVPEEVAAIPKIAKKLKTAARAPKQFSLAAFVSNGQEKTLGGYVKGIPNYGYRDTEMLFRLNVSDEYCGSGIGRKLVEELEIWARGRGFRRVTTGTFGHNSRALRFAGRLGFKQEVLSPNFALIDGRLADRIALGKVLS